MMTIAADRRSVLTMGLAAGAALATPQLMMRAAQAKAPSSQVGNPGFNRFRLGAFEITAINDGTRPGDGIHTIFGVDRDEAEVSALLEENFLPVDRFFNSFTPALVNTGSDLVLFDTGLGAGAREGGLGQLRARLEASGYAPGDVTVVVLTHFHGDHIGGLMENGEPAFPNARYVTGQAEYDFWTADERQSGPTENAARGVQANVVPLAEKTTFIGDGDAVAPGITGMLAAGHTPGHMIFHLESEGRRLLLTADTSNHYVASLRRPDWHVSFDMDREAGAATRARVFDMVAAERIPFLGYHMPFPAVGFIEKLDVGYRFVPASYQFLL
ncbi:MAG: MBL fold metallo-hydrolase [Aquamicrobium sp.]|uniref:MBL fold metallo-hydrolase n=1 Tax=Aquamicrobium sp. TaxID=1872579 RepID=UPI00349E6FE6|nr:MBL fold metallo-hydrolase [Aquamicrobium sp.]